MWCCCSTTSATNNTSWCLSILPSPGFCPHPFVKTDSASKQKSQAIPHHSVNQTSKWFSSHFLQPGYRLHSWCLRKLHRLLGWYMAIAVLLFEWQILKLKASSWGLQSINGRNHKTLRLVLSALDDGINSDEIFWQDLVGIPSDIFRRMVLLFVLIFLTVKKWVRLWSEKFPFYNNHALNRGIHV